jgi:predicted HNH restriction endonuclease
MKEVKKKASARGTRKSLVAEYKAKARGKKTSSVSSKKSRDKNKPVRRTPMKVTHEPILEMEVAGEVYRAGYIAHFVLEGRMESKKPHTGEIKECYPNDRMEPSVAVWDQTDGKYRTIRARLIGWTAAEAKKKWKEFLGDEPEKDYL